MNSAATNLILSEIARTHHGLIHHDLAAAAGIADSAISRRRHSNLLEDVGPRVSRVAGAPETWFQKALLAVWSTGPRAMLSHRAAAMLWQLDGFDNVPLEVLTDRWARKQRITNVKLHEAQDILERDRTVLMGIPCASIVRVLLDLPAVAHPYRADQAFEDALKRRLCTIEQVADRFIQVARRGRPGTVLGRKLIEKRFGGYVPTHSEFERRVSALITSIGLPAPTHQHRVDLASGHVAYIDIAFPGIKLGIECDGLFHHVDNNRLPWDDDRQNELVLAGWMIMRITWQQLTEQRDVVVRQIRDAFNMGSRSTVPANLR